MAQHQQHDGAMPPDVHKVLVTIAHDAGNLGVALQYGKISTKDAAARVFEIQRLAKKVLQP